MIKKFDYNYFITAWFVILLFVISDHVKIILKI